MSSDHLKQLFAEALALTTEKRSAFVAALRETDPRLADDLLSLLSAHVKAASFLSDVPRFPLARQHADLGSRIGPYRVNRMLARGGMGDVYEAISDEGGKADRVALKVVRLGTFTPDLIRRFNLERKTLAMLDHPNIARLLDGGTTADGMPYIAMEFVEGERIDEFCNNHQCSIDQRLNLFLSVCSAVQYAHGRLIVHRDLKPNNILVTGEGVPKLLDFGIAKLLESENETRSLVETRTFTNIFTPEFASPEQAGGREVTTASDVYSLGVLLYVLLTGRRPYDLSATKSVDLPAAIQGQEPVRPSSREITVECPEGKVRVRRRLKGDLDTIVLTALENSPSGRYISVEQFAEDIRRHLSHQPIQARPAPVGRRVVKFVRRNRALAGVGALVFAALVVGILVMLYQVQRAKAEKARVESVNSFLKQMLTYSNPQSQVGGNSRTPIVMQELLDDAARRLESDEFTSEPEVRIQLERMLGDAYCDQGRYDLMYQHYRKYIQLREEHPGTNEVESLDTLSLRALELFAKGKLPQSEALYRQTLPRMRTAYHEGKMKPELLAHALENFGYLRRTQGDSKEAESSFREVIELAPMFSGDPHFIVIVTRATLASVLADQGKFEEAMQTARDAVVEGQREGIASTPGFGFVLTIYGGFLTDAGRYAEADSALMEAEHIYRRLLSSRDLWSADNARNQGALLYREGRYESALTKAREAGHVYLECFGSHYDNYPTALTIEGLSLGKLDRPKEAERVLREAVNLRAELLPPGHFFSALAQGALGEFLLDRRRFPEAETLLVRSHNDLQQSQGPTNPRTLLARRRLHDLYIAWKKPTEAARFSL